MRRGLVIGALLVACGAARPRIEPPAAWTTWRQERHEELAGPDGWLALVGLFWLEPGTHVIGSAADAALSLPVGPAHLGRVIVADDVRFTSDDGSIDAVLAPDGAAIAVSDLRLLLISRGGRLALRVRDPSSPARASFGGIPTYDYDPAMCVRARVRACEPPGRMLSLVNVLGMFVDEPCAAVLDASIAGTPISLVATAAEDGYFVMLRDRSSDDGESYPGGRYLDVPAADEGAATWLDLNRLYTPPCGYTSLATCPLPPAENVVPIAIHAGERYERH
jgi:uncharacterized protein (DUF1684 family)